MTKTTFVETVYLAGMDPIEIVNTEQNVTILKDLEQVGET
jgi:hypothetical protein